ncbi:MAG: hypothetical protein ABI480_17120 [Chitinophagaceae bacterium]
MRKIVILCLCLCVFAFNTAGQQTPQSKWHTISRNRIIEFTITEDSIVDRQLDWNLTPRVNARNYRDAKPIKSLTLAKGNIYFIYKNDSEDSSRRAVISLVKSTSFPKLFFFNVDSADFSQGSTLQDFIRNDPKEKLGMFLLNEPYLNKLKAQKSIEQMTAEDLKKYIIRSPQITKQLDSLDTDMKTSNTRVFAGYFMIRYIFGEIGYNPLFTDEQFEAMIKKFQNRNDTRELLKHFFEQ